jgi:fucose permease
MNATGTPDDRLLSPARLIMAVFFIQGSVLANWFPRIPDVQAKLGIGPAELAVAILGMPVGIFAALMVAGRFVNLMSPRRTIIVGTAVYCAAMSLPGWSVDIVSLFLGLMVLGAVYSIVDVAINTEATAIQRRVGRRIISRCHGFWSLGAMVGALVASGFAEVAVSTGWHLLIVGAVTLVPINLIARALPPSQAVDASMRGPAFSLPSRAMVGLAVFAFGAILAEIATRNWAAVFLREVVDATPAATGIGYGAFSAMMAVGRFLGDAVAERFGPVAVARSGAIAGLAGVVAVAAAPTAAVAIVGLAVVGLGISVGYPLAVATAADRGDRPPATNVAALGLVAFSSTLVGPTLIGFVAEAGGLRIGLATMLPFVLASAFLAGHLGRGRDRLDARDAGS